MTKTIITTDEYFTLWTARSLEYADIFDNLDCASLFVGYKDDNYYDSIASIAHQLFQEENSVIVA